MKTQTAAGRGSSAVTKCTDRGGKDKHGIHADGKSRTLLLQKCQVRNQSLTNQDRIYKGTICG